MKFLPLLALAFVGATFAINCTPELSNPDPQPGDANFSKLVAIGGDFMFGCQDGGVTDLSQGYSLPNLIVTSLKEVGCPGFISNYLYSPDGLCWNDKPWESWYTTAFKLGFKTDCQGVTALSPVNDSIWRGNAMAMFANLYDQANVNFAIPYANTADFLSPALGNYPTNNTNPFYYHIASAPGTSTVLGDAVNANGTFFTAWLGMEDIYNYARNGGEGVNIMPASQFALYLDTIFTAMTANGAKGVVANIPDFREFPFYTLVPWDGAELTQVKADSLNDIYQVSNLPHIHFHEGSNGFVINDPNAPSGVRQIRRNEYITLGVPLDSMKCNYMGILFSTIPDRYVLDSSECAYLDQNIAAYNAVIEQKAAQYGLAFVDMHAYFRSVTAGIIWDGVNFNAEFVTGGFYSLDGYHPNQKGYSLIANEFIYAINAKYNATVPTVNCVECNGVLFP